MAQAMPECFDGEITTPDGSDCTSIRPLICQCTQQGILFFFSWGLCTISVCTRGARQVNKAKKERRLWEDIITGRTSQPLPGGKGRRAEDGGCCRLLLAVC